MSPIIKLEWEVTNSFSVRGVYGYRIILKYMDGSAKSQQKSGFATLAKNLKCVINLSMKYAINKKIIAIDPSEGINLPKNVAKKPYRTMNIDSQKTLTLEQIQLLIEESKKTPIHLIVLMNVLMGFRRSEIIGVKYSDIDYINRTLSVERQLYEKHRNRRKREFQDLDYVCCSTYGRPRSKDFHWKYYKKLLTDCGLPDIRWHDLRSTYCTLLLKNDFNPKAVSKLMGHAKEIVTIDVYGDNQGIISEGVPEITEYMEEVLPTISQEDSFKQELLEIVADTSEYMEEG